MAAVLARKASGLETEQPRYGSTEQPARRALAVSERGSRAQSISLTAVFDDACETRWQAIPD
jgi:hypothetical protein